MFRTLVHYQVRPVPRYRAYTYMFICTHQFQRTRTTLYHQHHRCTRYTPYKYICICLCDSIYTYPALLCATNAARYTRYRPLGCIRLGIHIQMCADPIARYHHHRSVHPVHTIHIHTVLHIHLNDRTCPASLSITNIARCAGTHHTYT